MNDTLWYILGLVLLIWCMYWPIAYWRQRDDLKDARTAADKLSKQFLSIF